MQHDITYYAKQRQAVKAFDISKKIPADKIEKIKELLRFAPSSVNAQPWHFIIASTDEAKAKIAKATAIYPFNTSSILNASHVVVFCSKLDIEQDYLLKVLEQEALDGRFDADPVFKDRMHGGRNMFIDLHKQDFKDVQHWMDKQVYLNLGAFLLGASALGIDAVPMEGIEAKVLDAEFGLREKGYTSLVVVPIGYSDAELDFNAKLTKSRLPYADILTEV
ncbi:oxygen-insensitive NAD(P)H nitroreductase [Shewanella sp. SG41-4]|uniref:oxygen-insensitive NAD(P)H nitroreductase n=1 Tax=Shewanella sp. SG41-4 TaxID=2760976 RepID=UPI0016012030|nr:oxygen-insensitive NAD(P)H nitroreductase [Shewanella sp. SG41-4]MBB1438179.1 oxygen-insensitive NAD(P)H nitroreductase [Shewanella sp. SG41-4]